MGEDASERTGLFVVRAWREEDGSTFRARVTWTVDLAGTHSHVVAVAETAEVGRALEQWLAEFGAEPTRGRLANAPASTHTE